MRSETENSRGIRIRRALSALTALCLLLAGLPEAAGNRAKSESAGGVVLNEVMSANASAAADQSGDYADWVEIRNAGQAPSDVGGWTLTDGGKHPVGFTFPNVTLAPGEIVVIWCDGKARQVKGFEYHAPFKISSGGESLILRDENGTTVEEIEVPALDKNESWARQADGTWIRTQEYTPGRDNTSENHALSSSGSVSGGSALAISEIMADNATYALDGGVRADYVEIRNTGSAPVSLAGCGLSDDEKKPGKYRFGNVTLGPGECAVVCADGRDGADHAPFRISKSGETVILSDADGRVIDRTACPALDTDRAWSRTDGGAFTADLPPTPGFPNDKDGLARTDERLCAGNTVGVYLNEAISSARKPNSRKAAADWVELFNAGSGSVDLSGFGLSDDPGHPRKWQFPQGASIGAGQYLIVYLNGQDKSKISEGKYAANFRLSFTRGETLTLSTPQGEVFDRLPVLGQKPAVSYGRVPGRSGYSFFEESTPGAANTTAAKSYRAGEVTFSRSGGWFTGGEVTVSLSAPGGAVIRYTLDCTEPTEQSPAYSVPLLITDTTIVRAKAFGEDMVPSMTATESFLFGEKHTLPVISLVADPAYLYDPKIGIYVMGEKKLKYPYKGANFWKDWERAANVEYFTPEGETLISQGIGLRLQGQYSRKENQKAFKLIARSTYGSSRFEGKLFPNRDYTSYKSFILRASGQDNVRTRMRDMVLTSLSEGLGVLYQDGFPVICYVNGEYFGHYNMRERIHKYSIAQWEGWTDVDAISIIKGNGTVMQGSDDSYQNLLKWIQKNGVDTDEELAYVDSVVDVENYLTYVAIQMYIGNTDLLNVKRYCSPEGDGRWKWALFDTDWAFNVDTDSFRRWLDPAGAGSGKKTNNTLFVGLMKNRKAKDRFLTILGRVIHDHYRTSLIDEKVESFYRLLEPEMPMHFSKWDGTVSGWRKHIQEFRKYAKSRPKKFLYYVQKDSGMSKDEMRRYFADIMDELGI